MENIEFIHSIFLKDVRPLKLLPWMPSTFSGYKTIQSYNRYFTSTKLANHSDAVPFDSLIDPYGVLASVDQSRYIHTAANNVGYFARLVTGNKTK
jgi:hypothetical protein